MKVGFIFECGPASPDDPVCRHLVHKLDPTIKFVPSTLDNKKKLVEDFTKMRRSDSFQRFALKVAGLEL